MPNPFYRAFEDRYRGSRQLILGRLEAYLPFVSPFLRAPQDATERPRAVDLGCGRGEWMELLRAQGFETHGVDLDEGMLAGCRDIGLHVTNGDALDYLQALPDGSQNVVSAFHVVEHISFDILERLVQESLRVLRPSGLLILETPNPESLIVGTELFHLDPTHERPIPHLLLSFLLEHHGFHRVKVVPLQEPEGIREKSRPGLQDVFDSVSPDYGAIGQKAAPPESLAPWDSPFAATYGQGLLELARRFDDSQTHWKAEAHDKMENLSQDLAGLTQGLADLSKEVRHLSRHAAEAGNPQAKQSRLATQSISDSSDFLAAAQRDLTALREQNRRLEDYVRALHGSTSWRLTAPVRWLSRTLRPRGRQALATTGQPVGTLAGADLPDTPLSPTGLQVYRHLQSTLKEFSRS